MQVTAPGLPFFGFPPGSAGTGEFGAATVGGLARNGAAVPGRGGPHARPAAAPVRVGLIEDGNTQLAHRHDIVHEPALSNEA